MCSVLKATRQLNTQLSRNSALRREIEEFMRERGAHCRLTKKLTNRLARGSKQLQNVVNQVSQVFDQRYVNIKYRNEQPRMSQHGHAIFYVRS